MRPGYLTSEFWVAVAKLVSSLVVIVGIFTVTDTSRLEGALTLGISVVGMFAANAYVAKGYGDNRTALKKVTEVVAGPPPAKESA